MDLDTLINLTKAIFALGLVIFVHELGHFLVARMCGVKCEKFYIGFDVFGLSLLKFRRGETEYGVGLIPLGGYVKMLGQDDNPAKAAQERERSRRSADAPESSSAPETSAGSEETLDPRSYLAQSVPERMAIISAGVVMNLVFAVLFAMTAYMLGVEYNVCAVGALTPGQAGWEAGMLPGDRIVQIGDYDGNGQPLKFNDLLSGVLLGNQEDGIRLKIKRDGVEEAFWITATPNAELARLRGRPMIGAAPLLSNKLAEKSPVLPYSPAAGAAAFQPGDVIAVVDGREIENYTDLMAALADNPEEPLAVQVARERVPEGGAEPASEDSSSTELSEVIEVPANPYKRLGLVMTMTAITAVQAGSPAEESGIKAGDILLSIDGEPLGDPLTLPDRLRRRGGETVTVSLQRDSTRSVIEKQVQLRTPDWYEISASPGSALSAPAMGISYHVENRVADVIEDSPAAAADISQGATVLSARLAIPSDEEKEEYEELYGTLFPTSFSDDEKNWPYFMTILQTVPPSTQVELVISKDSEERTVELKPYKSSESFDPRRGFFLEAEIDTQYANSLTEATVLGAREVVDSVAKVYRFLEKLIAGQIHARHLGGPGTIVAAAGSSAEQSFSQLLIFLTLLSANLAVINFLPIPILDGGHMVFLAYEGIRGKPPSEKVMAGLSYAGLLLILCLMLYVIGLDIKRLAVYLGWLAPD